MTARLHGPRSTLLTGGTMDLMSNIPVGDDGLSSTEVLALLDGRISYRQLDYWVRAGKVTPSISAPSGTGLNRRWSALDVVVLDQIAKMIARHMAEAADFACGDMWAELHRGLRVVSDDVVA